MTKALSSPDFEEQKYTYPLRPAYIPGLTTIKRLFPELPRNVLESYCFFIKKITTKQTTSKKIFCAALILATRAQHFYIKHTEIMERLDFIRFARVSRSNIMLMVNQFKVEKFSTKFLFEKEVSKFKDRLPFEDYIALRKLSQENLDTYHSSDPITTIRRTIYFSAKALGLTKKYVPNSPKLSILECGKGKVFLGSCAHCIVDFFLTEQYPDIPFTVAEIKAALAFYPERNTFSESHVDSSFRKLQKCFPEKIQKVRELPFKRQIKYVLSERIYRSK